ncbi:S46 family peptidase [Lutibacter citreus]|uniref:S46 family peptidase n=1 Tax=Lutibacter citreus TaxID=2138210 RepID=UPI000DBE6933|nr:S46 family peptidase [Lutibacter citreus]
MRNFKSYLLLAIAFISINTFAQVDTKKIQGGMWVPSLLEGMNENEMQLLGSKMTAEDIYSVNKSSLKDAIGHFGNGCTSELISSKGLLLTNHHCGFSRIQSHSSVEHDYLEDGFWAMSMEEELPNEGLTVTFIKRIDDVTSQVMAGVTDSMDETEKARLVNSNIQKVTKNVEKEAWQSAYTKEFFKGNQYMLFVVETFKDVRLVGAPPSSIGKYGRDTDNWMWPRHTGDFSMFRVYADANNRPAEYSKDNVPYKPAHHLPISLDGVEKYDFSMVFGFPGRTNEYLPAIGVDQIVNKINPAKIEIRDKALKIVGAYMKQDPEINIQYASKFASIANYWKKWIGESQGIHKTNAIEIKRELEDDFTNIVEQKELTDYKTILSDFESLYKEIEDVSLARDYWIEVAYRNVELLAASFKAFQLEQAFKRGGEEAFEKTRTSILESYKGIYKDYNAKVDESVFESLVELYAEKAPKEFVPENMINVDFSALTKDIFATTKFTSLSGVEGLLRGTGKEVIEKLNADKGYAFGKELHTVFYTKIEPTYQAINLKIAAVQKKYMKALMEVFPNKRFFPDANSTLRVNYGRVEGYEPKDGVFYTTSTTLKGVLEKYKPGDYEFDTPKKLRDLYETKDYGQYGEDGKMPVNYLSTNHMTGGNSGSPIVDAEGNMTGLAFDTTWEGTMSDLYFDADIVRSIAVDIRYVLFIIDKYAGATNLIDELDLVHPKK